MRVAITQRRTPNSRFLELLWAFTADARPVAKTSEVVTLRSDGNCGMITSNINFTNLLKLIRKSPRDESVNKIPQTHAESKSHRGEHALYTTQILLQLPCLFPTLALGDTRILRIVIARPYESYDVATLRSPPFRYTSVVRLFPVNKHHG